MPGLLDGTSKKRKRGSTRQGEIHDARSTSQRDVSDDVQKLTTPDGILLLESQVLESRHHYNNISKLISIVKEGPQYEDLDLAAALSLCRLFCRLMSAGSLAHTKGCPDHETIVARWLQARYDEYRTCLLALIEKGDAMRQSTALTLVLRVKKSEVIHLSSDQSVKQMSRGLQPIFRAVLAAEEGELLREEFVADVINQHDDLRYYTYLGVASIITASASDESISDLPARALAILSTVDGPPESRDDIENFYFPRPAKESHSVLSVAAHRKNAQDAWLSLLRLELDAAQRKTVLGLVAHRIAPCFQQVELLMDFLTDSYNIGGSTSLLALSGLFFLIREKNLDYPLFYQKLYSLLDAGLLHSQHRSRFFRLLDTFLASTHLPAALVASFIKRLARLSLHAPPAAIVLVIPWIYNLLKRHPTCTFMIHRETLRRTTDDEPLSLEMQDPFDMSEENPSETRAIDSSLWEIDTLQTHYHPNVATMAKIISEQFTKHGYSLEDFLDHSYATMLDAELSRDIKKAPVVEYEMPKKVFRSRTLEDDMPDDPLMRLWDFA
ncbi:MAG: hypothetical protein M1817_002475 [Caeruleum heppii]|nr:MAG: hypothetical protein M1817_002475 [Caeruleum heppii]